MASTLVVNQKGQRLGRIAGFCNAIVAYVDSEGVAWLPMPGELVKNISAQLADMANENEALRKRIAELEGND